MERKELIKMRKEHDLTNITRIKGRNKEGIGWDVVITCGIIKKRKNFYDSKYGGWGNSLSEAKKWRDKTKATMPKVRSTNKKIKVKCALCGKFFPELTYRVKGKIIVVSPNACLCSFEELGKCKEPLSNPETYSITDLDKAIYQAVEGKLIGSWCPCCRTVGNVTSIEDKKGGDLNLCTCCGFVWYDYQLTIN